MQLDRASAGRAEGVTIDFIEASDGSGFKIDNPNRPAVVREIAPKELKALLDSGKVTHFYDVRTEKERGVAKLADDLASGRWDERIRRTVEHEHR